MYRYSSFLLAMALSGCVAEADKGQPRAQGRRRAPIDEASESSRPCSLWFEPGDGATATPAPKTTVFCSGLRDSNYLDELSLSVELVTWPGLVPVTSVPSRKVVSRNGLDSTNEIYWTFHGEPGWYYLRIVRVPAWLAIKNNGADVYIEGGAVGMRFLTTSAPSLRTLQWCRKVDGRDAFALMYSERLTAMDSTVDAETATIWQAGAIVECNSMLLDEGIYFACKDLDLTRDFRMKLDSGIRTPSGSELPEIVFALNKMPQPGVGKCTVQTLVP